MTASSLTDVLRPALKEGYGIAGLVVLGWEDACAYVEAGESLGIPVVLQAGPGCRAHIHISVLGRMFRYLADKASIPVVCHIDHASTLDECISGIDEGFTSVMIDGSRLSFDENCELTARVTDYAHRHKICVEGELGFVGYDNGAISQPTCPEEAGAFVANTAIDALAISIGNVHLQTTSKADIDRQALREISNATCCPLVIHGASGLKIEDRQWLAKHSRVCKFNIGTVLRQTFAKALRQILDDDRALFDRNKILSATKPQLIEKTKQILQEIYK